LLLQFFIFELFDKFVDNQNQNNIYELI